MYIKDFDQTKPIAVSPNQPQSPNKNALKHGCCATNTLLLPTESAEDLKSLEVTWQKAYNPTNEAEHHLVAQLVESDWFLQRATRAYANVESELYVLNPNPAQWTEQQDRKLGRFLRYRTAHANQVHKCRKAIDDYRKARLAEQTNQEKLAIAQERLKTHQNKNKPAPTWKEHLEGMRQKAIALGFTPPELPSPPTNR